MSHFWPMSPSTSLAMTCFGFMTNHQGRKEVKGAKGRSSLNTTVWASGAEMFSALRKAFSIQAGPLPRLRVRSNDHRTASASTGSPLWNFAFLTRWEGVGEPVVAHVVALGEPRHHPRRGVDVLQQRVVHRLLHGADRGVVLDARIHDRHRLALRGDENLLAVPALERAGGAERRAGNRNDCRRNDGCPESACHFVSPVLVVSDSQISASDVSPGSCIIELGHAVAKATARH